MADPERLVGALHRIVAPVVGSRGRVAIAWSGGLASTLVAAIARKQLEVTCYCAERCESRDRRAAREAARVLDLPLVELDADPRTPADAIAATRAVMREGLLLTGETTRYGPLRRRSSKMARPLVVAEVSRTIAGRRASLAEAARFRGLLEAITASRHRGPRA